MKQVFPIYKYVMYRVNFLESLEVLCRAQQQGVINTMIDYLPY